MQIDYHNLGGWVYMPREIDKFVATLPQPTLAQAAPHLADSGAGKDAFQWMMELALFGKFREPHRQTIGDCTSHGTGGACEQLQITEMAHDPTRKYVDLATEAIYGLARVQIGRGGCGFGDGAVVGWAIDAVRQYGLVARQKYTDLGIDLSQYDGSRARQWGRPFGGGCPDGLLPIAKQHLVLNVVTIEGPDYYSQARDIIVNGGAVVTGSNWLYQSNRDKQGFCAPNGSGGHCTFYRGVTDNSVRPGIAYNQSWGPQVPAQGQQQLTLPHGRDVTLPAGVFFIDAENFNKMHARGGEVYGVTSSQSWVKPDSEIEWVLYN